LPHASPGGFRRRAHRKERHFVTKLDRGRHGRSDGSPRWQGVGGKAWEEVEQWKGTVYNYPVRPFHDAKPHAAALPPPPGHAVGTGTPPTV
jgi:hypothetical protein